MVFEIIGGTAGIFAFFSAVGVYAETYTVKIIFIQLGVCLFSVFVAWLSVRIVSALEREFYLCSNLLEEISKER